MCIDGIFPSALKTLQHQIGIMGGDRERAAAGVKERLLVYCFPMDGLECLPFFFTREVQREVYTCPCCVFIC